VGRGEHGAIAGPAARSARPTVAEVEALVAKRIMALPSFDRTGGPFPGSGGKGRIEGRPPRSPATRAALASLYVALMASVGLDLLDARSQVILDGGFADDPLFAALLAALRPGQPVAASSEPNGRALGAALLVGWAERQTPIRLALRAVEPASVPGLAAYAAEWRAAAEAIRQSSLRASARPRGAGPPA
jgi:sugar (pentulose or hexulose) kinase